MRKESSSAKVSFIAIIVLFCVPGFSTNAVLGEAAAVEEKTESQSQAEVSAYIMFLPNSPIRSLEEYHHTYRTYPAPVPPLYRPLRIPVCDFEIRRAKDQKRIARIPFTGYFRRHGEPGESDRRRIGQLPDGEYLAALCVGNARCSNVAKIKIDSGWEPKKEPALRLIGFPPGTGQKPPYLGLQAVGPALQDPELMNDMIAFASLIVDGVVRTPKMKLWVGPVTPLKPGQIYTRILDLNNYEPAIEAGLRHRIKAKVGKYESEISVIPTDDLPGKAWNRATPMLEPALPPQIVLEGQVIGPDGKPGSGYEVVLRDGLGKHYKEKCSEDGRYQFVNVPTGEYRLFSNPPGKGQPVLTVEEVRIKTAKTLVRDLSLERKFSFSGKVVYDDGTSAVGLDVMATWEGMDGKVEFDDFAVTDEKGRYALAAPFNVASYVGIGMAGPHPRPYRNVKAGRSDVNFVLKKK
jgi:hypothetical protein